MIDVSHCQLLFFLLLSSSRCCYSLYFLLPEGENKCFVEELPDETTVVGEYKIDHIDSKSNNPAQLHGNSKQGVGLAVNVKDPDGSTMMARSYGTEGKFSFTSNKPGDHTVCLWTNNTGRWFSGNVVLRVHFNLSVGEQANDYEAIAKSEKLNELQIRIRQLMDQVSQIMKEQQYQRVREERFRSISEEINSRVILWAIFQSGILLAIGFWQMSHLKGFFEAKKVV
ncbi:transmembrane emp24 domain-containing protein eca-like [Paramacrobiotus metropolitanus]|uniref:transmembrane emp24 domain-containing protein eca-like n=1 Tax=Paramacrobiotus metropolitanus TaxID=2943436 RepID=UPI002445BE35|nr:transmembrane emp24 domain-containing protein eca-like [Paramacrobiotus metropolitanus]